MAGICLSSTRTGSFRPRESRSSILPRCRRDGPRNEGSGVRSRRTSASGISNADPTDNIFISRTIPWTSSWCFPRLTFLIAAISTRRYFRPEGGALFFCSLAITDLQSLVVYKSLLIDNNYTYIIRIFYMSSENFGACRSASDRLSVVHRRDSRTPYSPLFLVEGLCFYMKDRLNEQPRSPPR